MAVTIKFMALFSKSADSVPLERTAMPSAGIELAVSASSFSHRSLFAQRDLVLLSAQNIRGGIMFRLTHWTLSIPILLWVGSSAPALAQATTSIKCGNTTYEVSTGTKSGNCDKSASGSQICTDGSNYASANCESGCIHTGGSGSCTIKAVQTPPPKNPPKGKGGVTTINVGGVQPPKNPPQKGKGGISVDGSNQPAQSSGSGGGSKK